MSSRRSPRDGPAGQSGQALIEFAIIVPLFLTVLWGLVTLVSVARARCQVAIVTHAVVREVAGGVTKTVELTELAKAYARAAGMPGDAVAGLTVEIRNGGGGLGIGTAGGGMFGWVAGCASWTKQVTVRARVRVPDSLKLLTGPLVTSCSNECLAGTWKAPWDMLNRMIGLPDPSREKPEKGK